LNASPVSGGAPGPRTGERGLAPGPHHFRRHTSGDSLTISVTEAGWRYLDFSVYELRNGDELDIAHSGREVAVVPVVGRLEARAGGKAFQLDRKDIFSDPPHVLYVPPGEDLSVGAKSQTTFAVGGAPAEGRYPVRLIEPHEMRTEMRGGGPALRQVGHVLAAPLPAERLVLYEVVARRGGWCGWPPHCHDGFDGSPYLEETYYFRFDRPDGFALQRNYRTDEEFDEVFVARHGDVVLVTKGYHSTVAAPDAHMYFLNYLAGEPMDQERARPPCFDPRYTWITNDWAAGDLVLPTGSAAAGPTTD
jgi:5-deoxy-glucuronate isomerase